MHHRSLLILTLGSLFIAPVVHGQDNEELNTRHEIDFHVFGGYTHQFEDDLEGGQDVDVDRTRVGVSARTRLGERLTMTGAFRYALDDYGFDGPSQFAGMPPWSDIHTFTFAAIFNYDTRNGSTIFGGPVFKIARESGGDTDEAWTGGGILGIRWLVDNEIMFGIGAGVTSQIEDDVQVFPIILIDWKLTDQLRLTTSRIAAATDDGGPGVELVYEITDSLEAAIGVKYEFSRFRLDADGPFPNGVGEETRFPIYLRVGYQASERVNVGFFGGFLADGELELESSTGAGIAKASYDGSAFFAGGFVSIRF